MKKAIDLLEQAKGGIVDAQGPLSGETANYVLDDVISLIDEALAYLQAPPHWETPEQWEKRTREKYPDRAPVWCADNDDPADPWFLDYYENAVEDERCYIVCAVGGLVLPNDWRPEEAE